MFAKHKSIVKSSIKGGKECLEKTDVTDINGFRHLKWAFALNEIVITSTPLIVVTRYNCVEYF